MRWTLLIALWVSSAVPAMTPALAELSGVYVKEPTGTLWDLGVQLVVTTSGRGVDVILRCGKGTFSGVPEVLAAQITRGTLSFSLPADGDSRCPAGHYEGRFQVADGVATTLTLKLPSGDTALELSRQSAFAPAGMFYPYE